MTILTMGGEVGSCIPSDASVFETTVSGSFDPTWVRCALRVNSYLSYADTPAFASTGDFWWHEELILASAAGTRTVLSFLENSTEVFQIVVSGGATNTIWQMQYWSGSAWVNIGSSFSATGGTLQKVDVHIVAGASGSASMYLSGTLRSSGSASMTAFAGITKARMRSPNDARHSQWTADTTSTIGRQVPSFYPTGNGANTAWTGAFGDVDEIVYNDFDGINSGTATQVETYTCSTPAVLGFKVLGVGVTARAREGATGPTGLQLALRTSATNYFSATIVQDVAYGANVGIWEQNPNTTADWVTAVAQAVEIGVKSIA